MKVFITGANGYLGGWIVHTLENRGHEIYGEDSHHGWICGRGPAYMRLIDADVIVHLAWYSSVGDGQPELQQHCLDETDRLVRALGPSQRLIFASTASVYGNDAEWIFAEEDATNPGCAYTRAKVAAEERIRDVLPNQHLILRYGSMMGLGLTRTKTELCVNAFAVGAYLHHRIEVWNPSSWKPLLHVRDAAELLVDGIEKQWSGTLNACTYSLQAELIAGIAAKQVPGTQVVVSADRSGPGPAGSIVRGYKNYAKFHIAAYWRPSGSSKASRNLRETGTLPGMRLLVRWRMRKKEINLIARAMKERWPMSANKRKKVIAALLWEVENSEDHRTVVAAARALIAADALNLEQLKQAAGSNVNLNVSTLDWNSLLRRRPMPDIIKGKLIEAEKALPSPNGEHRMELRNRTAPEAIALLHSSRLRSDELVKLLD